MILVMFKALTVLSCLSIVFMGLFMGINKMGPKTNHFVRIAWILITCGAFGVALAQIFGKNVAAPGMWQTAAWLGTAIFLAFDRREFFMPNKHPRALSKAPDSAN